MKCNSSLQTDHSLNIRGKDFLAILLMNPTQARSLISEKLLKLLLLVKYQQMQTLSLVMCGNNEKFRMRDRCNSTNALLRMVTKTFVVVIYALIAQCAPLLDLICLSDGPAYVACEFLRST